MGRIRTLVARGSTHTIAAIRPSRARSAVLALEASGAGSSDVSGKTNVALGVWGEQEWEHDRRGGEQDSAGSGEQGSRLTDVAPEVETSLGKICTVRMTRDVTTDGILRNRYKKSGKVIIVRHMALVRERHRTLRKSGRRTQTRVGSNEKTDCKQNAPKTPNKQFFFWLKASKHANT
jgi:hypothetical protein